MRQFYETWQQSPKVIRQLSIGELPREDSAFIQIGFTHHVSIFSTCKSEEERWYYIRRCAAEFWSVATLKSHLRANDFLHQGMLANNFFIRFQPRFNLSKKHVFRSCL